jgi:hypothetical protein
VQRNSRRVAIAAGAFALVLALSGFRYTGFSDAAAKTAGAKGVAYLKTQQKADGSFEVAGFPGFETPDAVLAIAENAQTTATWNKAQAKAAVDATRKGASSVLHAVDDYVDAGINAGQAAKIVQLVARPLAVSVNKFDPDKDGHKVNLRGVIDAGLQSNGSYGAFNATLYAAIAKSTLGGVPAKTLAYIRAAQEAGGGFNYAGDKTGTSAQADIDTTGLAIEALVAAKVAPTDTDLRQALAYFARLQRPSGAFQSFGSNDPNSTSLATMAITAAGYDPYTSCWRDTAVPTLKNTPYTSPVTWLESDQLATGRFQSPNDGFGINTFPTSQSVQALRRGWMPIKTLPKQQCS